MAEEFLKTDPEADDENLIVESKRAINYLQVQRSYRYVEFLAQGAYGWVSLVYDDAENRPLAIKCTTTTSELELTRWPKLQHDAILPLIEYITLDSCTVFIMPAMRKDLWMCVSEPQFYEDELSFGLCRIWLGDVATALDYLHKQNLCHLDLKLDNVFLKDNGRACLGDFSLLSDSREVPDKFNFLELYEPPEYTNWCHSKRPEGIPDGVQFGGDKADMWQYGILSLDLLTNLSLSGERSNYFTLWHHDVWPFIQKVLLHKEYLEYLMEDAFQNVFFNSLDFELCHEFLEQFLVIEPNARATAADAMKHEFVDTEWPQIPASFGMPKKVDAHISKHNKEKKASKGDEEEKSKQEETPSQIGEAADVLKKKMQKIKKDKKARRQTLAALGGQHLLMIKRNISTVDVDPDSTPSRESNMSEVEVNDDAVIKKSVEPNKRVSKGARRKTVTSISPRKKLVVKIGKDPVKSKASLTGSSKKGTEKAVRFLSSSSGNVRRNSKDPRSKPKSKSSSLLARRSLSAKKSSEGVQKSPKSKNAASSEKSTSSKKSTSEEQRARHLSSHELSHLYIEQAEQKEQEKKFGLK